MKKLILTIIFFITIPVLISSSKYQPVRLKQKLISNLKQEPVKPVIKPDELIEALI